jgi:hypothetical protein
MSQSHSRCSQFSLGERARVPVQFLSRTIGMTALWAMMWKVVAPMVGVRVVGPVEAFSNLFESLLQSVMASLPSVAGTGAGAAAGGSLLGPAVQFAFILLLWLLPVCVALSGVATFWTAVEYGVDRVAGPPAVAATGGEV